MTTYHEPQHLSDLLLVEVAKGWTTQQVSVKTDHDVPLGTVVYQQGNEPYYITTTDNFDSVVGVLAQPLKASAKEQKALVILRGAVLAKHALAFQDNATDENKHTVMNWLDNKGIIIQDTH